MKRFVSYTITSIQQLQQLKRKYRDNDKTKNTRGQLMTGYPLSPTKKTVGE
jgi:hypothetical protein